MVARTWPQRLLLLPRRTSLLWCFSRYSVRGRWDRGGDKLEVIPAFTIDKLAGKWSRQSPMQRKAAVLNQTASLVGPEHVEHEEKMYNAQEIVEQQWLNGCPVVTPGIALTESYGHVRFTGTGAALVWRGYAYAEVEFTFIEPPNFFLHTALLESPVHFDSQSRACNTLFHAKRRAIELGWSRRGIHSYSISTIKLPRGVKTGLSMNKYPFLAITNWLCDTLKNDIP